MSLILTTASIILFAASLSMIIIRSNEILFVKFSTPYLWIFFMSLLGLITFLIGSLNDISSNMVFGGSLIALLFNMSLQKNKKPQIGSEKASTKVEIKSEKLKYRLGVIAYAVGGILGWLVFY